MSFDVCQATWYFSQKQKDAENSHQYVNVKDSLKMIQSELSEFGWVLCQLEEKNVNKIRCEANLKIERYLQENSYETYSHCHLQRSCIMLSVR
jgi:hypothetical protein